MCGRKGVEVWVGGGGGGWGVEGREASSKDLLREARVIRYSNTPASERRSESSGANARRAMPTMPACYIVQYFHHPRQLSEIVRRLVHPASKCSSMRTQTRLRTCAPSRRRRTCTLEFGSPIRRTCTSCERTTRWRGSLARRSSSLRRTTTSPPPTPAWVDRLLLVFETLAAPPAVLAAVGLFRGKTTMWNHRVEEEEEGWRNDVATGVHACNSTRYGHGPVAPITFAADLTLSPIAVRTDAFLALGGFNESYSEPGKPAMGLEHELTARLWEAGYAAAVACPTEASIFRRGCGLRGTWANKESVAARAYASYHNSAQFAAQFDERRAHAIEQRVRARNAWIRGGDARRPERSRPRGRDASPAAPA